MPTYEYICEACKNEFEKFQQMSAAPVRKCPKCGKSKVQRKISVGGGIIFKGGGFYETDYRNEAYKKAADADKPGENKGETKPQVNADAKPAETKVEAKPTADQPAKVEAAKPSEPAAAATAQQAKSSSAKRSKSKK